MAGIRVARSEVDFNIELQERDIENMGTARKVCRASRDNEKVMEALDDVWKQPEKSSS